MGRSFENPAFQRFVYKEFSTAKKEFSGIENIEATAKYHVDYTPLILCIHITKIGREFYATAYGEMLYYCYSDGRIR